MGRQPPRAHVLGDAPGRHLQADARPGERMFSVFAVVRNPSDQWPLYACIVIAAGMLMHFGRKLLRYVRSEVRTA